MNKRPRRILGLTFDDIPIFEPPDAGSSLTLAAAGRGKTTCVALPALLSMVSDRRTAIVAVDMKTGEIAAQISSALAKTGRRHVVVDDLKRLGEVE